MRILGIDPSLTATGMAIIEDGQPVHWLVVNTTPDTSEGGRLDKIAQVLDKLLHANYDYLDAVAMEGYAPGAKFNRERMGQVGGVVKLTLFRHNYIPQIWAPTEWRKVVLGEARVAKDQVRLKTFQRYGVDIEDHNGLEAYCIAMAEHLLRTGTVRPRPKKRKLPPETEAA